MTVEKVTISLPRATLQKARGAIRRGRAKSLSAYVASAVEKQTDEDDLARLLDEMLEETGGPMTRSEAREADRILAMRQKGHRPRRKR